MNTRHISVLDIARLGDRLLRAILAGAHRLSALRPINRAEFGARRAAGDYADPGEEAQLAHYTP